MTVEQAQAQVWTPERIKELRRRLQVTQRTLAEQLDIRHATICHWETGQHTVSPRYAQKLDRMEAKADGRDIVDANAAIEAADKGDVDFDALVKSMAALLASAYRRSMTSGTKGKGG